MVDWVTANPRTAVSDERLAAAARGGDRDAYAALAERYRPLAYACAFAFLRTREDAEDAVQEAMVNAYRALGRYDPRRAWGPWLMRIVRNQCRDLCRRRRIRKSVALELVSAEQGPSAEMLAIAAEDQRRLQVEVAALPERLRAPILLHYAFGLTYKETALALGIPESTVVGRIAGGLRHLRRRYVRERNT